MDGLVNAICILLAVVVFLVFVHWAWDRVRGQ